MAWTSDDSTKTVFGILAASFLAAISWLVRSVMRHEKESVATDAKIKELTTLIERHSSDDVAAFKRLDEKMLTKDGFTEMFEAVLEKREKLTQSTRADTIELQHLRLREIISEEINKALPKLRRGLITPPPGMTGPPTPGGWKHHDPDNPEFRSDD